MPNNVAYQWIEGDAMASVFLQPSGTDAPSANQGSNGLSVDAQGRMLLCQHGSRRVARLGGDGKFEPLATKNHEGVRFNSPNDLCVAKDGSLYFTDPPYGLPKGEKSETQYHGVYKLAPDGKVSLVTKRHPVAQRHRPEPRPEVALPRRLGRARTRASQSATSMAPSCGDVFIAAP
ncbi:gluconolactonase [Opitutia bacterium]|nr:gluconolactonase [Opitutae bacterium]